MKLKFIIPGIYIVILIVSLILNWLSEFLPILNTCSSGGLFIVCIPYWSYPILFLSLPGAIIAVLTGLVNIFIKLPDMWPLYLPGIIFSLILYILLGVVIDTLVRLIGKKSKIGI